MYIENERTLLKDKIIKKILSGNTKVLKQYVKELLEEITKKEVGIELSLIHPNVGVNKNVVNSEVDIVYETKECYYNIEVNKDYSTKLDKKNLAYIHQLSLRSIKKSKDYRLGKKVIQINIDNYDRFKKAKFVYKTSLIEENIYKKRNEEIEIYDINLDWLKKVDYNDIKKIKLAKLLYLFVEEDLEKITKMYEGDELMTDVKKEAEKILENFDALLYYDPYELGKEVGMDKGRDEAKIQTAHNLIKAGIDLGIISKATNISIQDLQKMQMKKDINIF